MNEAKLVRIVVKDEERQATYKHEEYGDMQASESDPIIISCVKEAMKSFPDHNKEFSIKWSVSGVIQ